MTCKESLPAEVVAPAQQQVVGTPDIHKGMYLMGNHPAKMVTLLALLTFSPGEYVTGNMLENRFRELQGETEAWALTSPALFAYCKYALKPPGFVEFGLGAGKRTGSSVKAVRLVEKGRLLGPIIVGALWPLEQQSLERSESGAENVLFLQTAMGETRCYPDGRIGGTPTRLAIYDALLKRWPEGAAEGELKSAECRLAFSGLEAAIKDLCHLGVLCKTDNYEAKRTFVPSEKFLEYDIERLTMVEVRTIVTAAANLRAEGATQITGKDILLRAEQLRPDLSKQKMWKEFTAWVRRPTNAALLQEAKLTDNRKYNTQVRIPTEHKAYLVELLKIRRLLVEDSAEAESFRTAAKQRAETEILTSAQLISRLLARTRRATRAVGTHGATDWALNLTQLIPPEGIDVAVLHRRVVEAHGRHIGYRSFRNRLNRLPGMVMTELARPGRPGKPIYVSLAKQVFPKNWADKAACLNEDPELFQPSKDQGYTKKEVLERVQKAKEICHDCPVKLPCLKKALDEAETDGVRGEVWFKRRSRELSPERTRFIQHVVQIK